MKKLFALLLAVCMVLTMAACTTEVAEDPSTETPSTDIPVIENPTESEAPSELTPTGHNFVGGVCQDEGCSETLTTENPLTYLSLSYSENFDSVNSVQAYDQYDGNCYLETITTTDRIRGTMPIAILENLTFALEESGLLALVGQDAYTDGEASGSLYAEYADGTAAMVSFSGTLPEEFINGYTYMDAYFQGLTAEMTPYIPQPMIQGEINETDMAELQLILDGAQLADLDSYAIMEIPKDEFFCLSVGLSSDEGIARATTFTAMNMATAYSVTILTLDDAATAEAVCADLENSLDWRKWVCVAPSEGLIAVKDNMVLLLLGSDEIFAQTVTGINGAGWTTARELSNPDMT